MLYIFNCNPSRVSVILTLLCTTSGGVWEDLINKFHRWPMSFSKHLMQSLNYEKRSSVSCRPPNIVGQKSLYLTPLALLVDLVHAEIHCPPVCWLRLPPSELTGIILLHLLFQTQWDGVDNVITQRSTHGRKQCWMSVEKSTSSLVSDTKICNWN